MITSFIVTALASVAFVGLATAFIWEGRTAPTRRVRNLAYVAGAVSLQFPLGTAWSAWRDARQLGWISESAWQLGRDWLGVGLTTTSLAVGLLALRLILRPDTSLHQAERMTAILAARIPLGADVGLTAREVQVLEYMSQGTIKDDDLSAALSISPATAATHVRNIMRKAGVSERRDLLLLAAEDLQ